VAGPLDDITVLEVANWVAAPSCGALMADLGADVIKVEPLGGDGMRGKLRQPSPANGMEHADVPFQLDNRGKRSLAVDIANPEGSALVRELAARAGRRHHQPAPRPPGPLRPRPDQLRAEHPGLVYALVTGFGSVGPDADRSAFDLTAFFGRGGVMSLVGSPGDPPHAFRPGQGDHPTGLALLAAVLAALRVRDRTGEGQVVETALMRTAAWSIGATCRPPSSTTPSRTAGSHRALQPAQHPVPLRDGVWVNLSTNDQRLWGRFCAAIDRPDLADDERFATPVDRFRNGPEVMAILDAELGSQPFATGRRGSTRPASSGRG
jgi:crotonobetainyl-CoA:carnitine CoA-transferase CaiB-like acyl-CoA transferase